MPNSPPLDASVQWKIRTGAVRFAESGYRSTVEEILSAGLGTEVVGLISAGKEADVYLARLGGAPLVVKVFRLYRTSHRGGGPIKLDNMAWRAAFEFEALRMAWKGGAPVPTPAKRVENMVAMRYLGSDAGPAPRLVDVEAVDPEGLLVEVLAAVESLVTAGILHGDLSAYNVLVHEDRPFFIDFSDARRVDRVGQSPWRQLALAEEILVRDLAGLAAYFGRFGVALDMPGSLARFLRIVEERMPRKRVKVRRQPPEDGSGTPEAVPPRLDADAPEPESLHEAD